jgi:hypothetical protein
MSSELHERQRTSFMNDLSSALAILTAMLTPALLISACGSLTISISHRFGRTIDRTRNLLQQYRALSQDETGTLVEEQRAMTGMHLAIAVFVATSVAIGVEAILGQEYAWLPLGMGMIGAALLFYSVLLLVVEARLTQSAINAEMDFTLRLSRHEAPEALLKLRKRRFFARKNTQA